MYAFVCKYLCRVRNVRYVCMCVCTLRMYVRAHMVCMYVRRYVMYVCMLCMHACMFF